MKRNFNEELARMLTQEYSEARSLVMDPMSGSSVVVVVRMLFLSAIDSQTQ
jgi:hypothetical protein